MESTQTYLYAGGTAQASITLHQDVDTVDPASTSSVPWDSAVGVCKPLHRLRGVAINILRYIYCDSNICVLAGIMFDKYRHEQQERLKKASKNKRRSVAWVAMRVRSSQFSGSGWATAVSVCVACKC